MRIVLKKGHDVLLTTIHQSGMFILRRLNDGTTTLTVQAKPATGWVHWDVETVRPPVEPVPGSRVQIDIRLGRPQSDQSNLRIRFWTLGNVRSWLCSYQSLAVQLFEPIRSSWRFGQTFGQGTTQAARQKLHREEAHHGSAPPDRL